MNQPHLTFFCELESHALQALFHNPSVLENLQALHASISMGLIDLSPERAEMVRRLNEAGVPVTGWLLLPRDEGYWFNLDNAPQAAARYDEFRAWANENGLHFAGVGLDIEPDIRELEQFVAQPWGRAWLLVRRAFDAQRVRRGRALYADLVARIRADGYPAETYQFAQIVDERMVGSTLIQRVAGLVDVPAPTEVLMLYTSFLDRNGPGALWSYAPDAGAIAVGSTGGGVDTLPKLTWDELARDLRLAQCWTDNIYIFSLEGCVQQDFLERLLAFDWNEPVEVHTGAARQVDMFRRALRGLLWLAVHPAALLAIPAAYLGIAGLRRLRGGQR